MRIGIDLGGTKIEGILLNSHGDELERLRVQTPRHDYAETLNAVCQLVQKIEKPFGNLTTNISGSMLSELDVQEGEILDITLLGPGKDIKLKVPFVRSFGFVKDGESLSYLDSSDRLGLAINQGDFSARFSIEKAMGWIVQ